MRQIGQKNDSSLLFIEEDQNRRKTIISILEEYGWQVVPAESIKQAQKILSSHPFALIVLALRLSGANVLREAQQLCVSVQQSRIMLLMLVEERDMEIALLERLGLSATDYLFSPFQSEELCACIQTLLRRSTHTKKQRKPRVLPQVKRDPLNEVGQILEIENLRIDVAGRQAFLSGREIHIGSPILFDLLVYLVRHQGEVLSPQQLLQHVWGDKQDHYPTTRLRTVYVHIRWLRFLIEEDPSHPQYIQTLRGSGYQFGRKLEVSVTKGE
jgi:DNA-binding response OmpR family regulator